ncbi:hypothetical protein FBY04_12027 [Pseudomonas sp. SJZ080]|uniref:hypothetical protein n=1 Tax=Pseudomonas sp. SJZ080 TaxID=2572888 RepID=UPI00119973C1|nr:hypothetical protein [Pseudomonas sp. SJZ080]TWC50134.1 hypothetical protein FBY04_12027 [Pseudomonas sp. SJZ080]
MKKPVMQWACRELVDGWVMIGVDVDLSAPGEPEGLLGYRRAVHPFQFDGSDDPVMDFSFVIAEMTCRVMRGVEGAEGAQLLSASRARAFGG